MTTEAVLCPPHVCAHENTYTVGHIVQRTQETVINDLTDGYVKPAPSSPTHEDSKWLPNTGLTSGPTSSMARLLFSLGRDPFVMLPKEAQKHTAQVTISHLRGIGQGKTRG